MTSPRTNLIMTLACVGWLGASGDALAASGPDGAAGERVQVAQGGWFGGHRRSHGRGFGRMCNEERRSEWIEDRLGLVESFADFGPEQAEAWTRLTAAVRAGSTKIGAACAEFEAEGPAENAPERLARAEAMMTTGLGIVQELRPAFDDFYAVLDDEQKAALDRVVTKWHRR